ncbi:MAG: UDP-N-acetylmuramate dehydrogenase, partial [bacterium]|nr:UDP-N-acetylmuramate dehydrogenase [bacterium]
MNNPCLEEKLSGLKQNEPLAKQVNFRIGGPARYFFEAASQEDFLKAVQAATECRVPFFVIGGGSNVLVSDAGFDGLIIKSANRKLEIRPDGIVVAEAGIPSALVARKTAEAGLTGFEWAVSLPGTIGGAVRGNAGCFGGEIKDVVKNVDAFDVQKSVKRQVSSVKCEFKYRDSIFKRSTPNLIVLSVELQLAKDDPAACVARVEEKLAARREHQPLESSSAGCLFKNFEFQDEREIEKLKKVTDVPQEFISAKRIPAGWIIDQLGLKGHQIGD